MPVTDSANHGNDSWGPAKRRGSGVILESNSRMSENTDGNRKALQHRGQRGDPIPGAKVQRTGEILGRV